MNQARQYFLAGAAFAEDQYGGRKLRHLPRRLEDLPRRPARADDELAVELLGDLGAKLHDVPAQILPLAGVTHECPDSFELPILGDVVIRAVPHCLDGRLELLDYRDDDHFD